MTQAHELEQHVAKRVSDLVALKIEQVSARYIDRIDEMIWQVDHDEMIWDLYDERDRRVVSRISLEIRGLEITVNHFQY